MTVKMQQAEIIGEPEILRFSSIVRRARERGFDQVVEALEKARKGNDTCPNHGLLEDPIVLIQGKRGEIAFCCPFCSAPEVLEAWEDEGKRGVA